MFDAQPTSGQTVRKRRTGAVKSARGLLDHGAGGRAGRRGNRQQGRVPESQLNWVTSYGDDCGTEWAYVIADRALSVFEHRRGSPENNEGHMTGMFGFGAGVDGGYWHLVGVFPWDGDEPNWEAVERGAYDTAALTAGEGS